MIGGLEIEPGSRDVTTPTSETACHLYAGTA